jgi:hypothetical protein
MLEIRQCCVAEQEYGRLQRYVTRPLAVFCCAAENVLRVSMQATESRGLDFPDIDAVAPWTENDAALFDELRAVLERHGATSRFGISLLHRHFEIDADEVLVETCDVDARTLVTRPYARHEIRTRPTIDTNWRFDGPNAVAQECWQWCFRDDDAQSHLKSHRPVDTSQS